MDTTPRYETLGEREWAALDRIDDLLDEGELDEARIALDALMRDRPSHPDLLIADATLKLEEGEPHQALAAVRGAERSADPAHFFFLRAACLYDLTRFEEAEADAQRSITIQPGEARSYDLLSRVREHRGDASGAAEAAEAAAGLDGEHFPEPLEVSDDAFDANRRARPRGTARARAREARRVPRHRAAAAHGRDAHRGGAAALTRPAQGCSSAATSSRNCRAPCRVHPATSCCSVATCCAPATILTNSRRRSASPVQHEVGHLMGLDEDDLDEWGLS
jgi:tetratricopeptide (TPR) repeat protein